MRIPFNRPFTISKELQYIADAVINGQLSGDGVFTKKCHEWLEKNIGCAKALLTHSCTAALEMTAILADIQPGDEIIMPSFTFVSTANAFVLRGGIPVFVDIRPDTLNIDELKIEAAITSKTKAIVVVHYAGVACEMDTIMSIADKHGLLVIEDAAQGIGAFYKGRPLGSIGHMAALSFHETKNVIAGEGGALLINAIQFCERAEIIREKGTNRTRFLRGQVDKYTWVDIGSSYLPGELIAAFLFAQLENVDKILKRRLEIWHQYERNISPYCSKHLIEIPVVPEECAHNGHLFYIKFKNIRDRSDILQFMKQNEIGCLFHYVPLHSSEAGQHYGRFCGEDVFTTRESERIVRLPIYFDMKDEEVERVSQLIINYTKESL